LADYDRAIELTPGRHASVIFARGHAYREMGRYDQALADFDRATELSAADARVFTGRGQTYGEMGQYDQALADLNRAIELGGPNQALAIFRRGETYRRMGHYDRALADFDHAIELDPAEDEFAAARTEICQVTGGSDDDALPSNRGTTAT